MMKMIALRHFAVAGAVALMLSGGGAMTAAQAVDPTPDFEELTRGPLHEAFAEQVNLNPQPGIVVPEAPPEPIQEVPPQVRPADERAIWIDGYWAYDDVAKEFLWVSGGWRIAPHHQRWVPGYWKKNDAGFQWVGGFWTASERDEITYLPQPPATLEEGPTSAAPGEGYFWSPGCWLYRGDRYDWRPGHWAASHPSYVWIPRYYRWTPRGYVLCDGYWDGALRARGYLFAPLAFHRPVYTATTWQYTPRVLVDFGPLHLHLFVRPSCSHYYFGDWYGDSYAKAGYFAWHDYYVHRHCHDPLFTYNVVRYRSRGIDFHDRIRGWHHWFHDHADDRPRHTYRQQREFERERGDAHGDKHGDKDHAKIAKLGSVFEDAVHAQRGKFSSLDGERRRRWEDERTLAGKLRQQRAAAEAAVAASESVVPRVKTGGDNAQETRRIDMSELPKFKLNKSKSTAKTGGQVVRPPFSAATDGQGGATHYQRRDGQTERTAPGAVDFIQSVRDRARNDVPDKSNGQAKDNFKAKELQLSPNENRRFGLPAGSEAATPSPPRRGSDDGKSGNENNKTVRRGFSSSAGGNKQNTAPAFRSERGGNQSSLPLRVQGRSSSSSRNKEPSGGSRRFNSGGGKNKSSGSGKSKRNKD